MTEPCDLTAVEARRLIGQKKLAPTELLASCIARIEAVDHAVNAMVARDFDRARATAKAADAAVARGDELPPLHGLPIGIKDLQDTEGLRTTYGSTIYRDHVPAADERLVAAVRAAGAIVVGKTNTPEFGAGANTRNAVYGATGNPFDPTLSAAGSSGGSAVALATGMVPICSGSDTGGSLRNPAAFSGIVGFRPTPGLVANERRGLGWNNLSVAGPMARTVPDLCLLLSAMVSDDARDPLATTVHGRTIRRPEDFAVPARVDLSRLRVALTPDFGFAPTERHIAEVFAEKTALFRHVFARAEDTTPDCAGADEAFEVLRAVGVLASHLERVRTRPQDVGPNVRANVEEGLRYSRGRCRAGAVAADRDVSALAGRSSSDWDVILTPSITISPRPWRELYPGGDRRQADPHLFPLAGARLRRDAAGSSRGVAAGGARPPRHAVRPADRRPARRRCVRAVGRRRTGGAAGRRSPHRAPGSGLGAAEGGAADQRNGGVSGVRLSQAMPVTGCRPCR